MKHSFQLMTDRVNSNPESVKLFELEVFQSFKWLLTAKEKATLAEWVKSTLKHMAGTGGGSKASGSQPDAKQHTSATGKAKDKHAHVLSYFG